MIAACHLKTAAHIRVGARFNILDPCAIHPERHLIFRLARCGTGVASNALTLVDQKSIIGHKPFHHEDTESDKRLKDAVFPYFTFPDVFQE